MTDERLRGLKRRWTESGLESDKKQYFRACAHAGNYSPITAHYSPQLKREPTPASVAEYLNQSPVAPVDQEIIKRALDELRTSPSKLAKIWLTGTALVTPNYASIDLLVADTWKAPEQQTEIVQEVADWLSKTAFAGEVTPPTERPILPPGNRGCFYGLISGRQFIFYASYKLPEPEVRLL